MYLTLPLQKGLLGGQVVKSMTMDPEVPVWHHKVTGISFSKVHSTLPYTRVSEEGLPLCPIRGRLNCLSW